MIHPSSVVADGARIGAGVHIGPFCTIGPEVSIGAGARLISHVVVDGRTVLGEQVTVYPFATVGMAPQDLKYKDEPTATEIGPRSVIREHCTIHRGTVTGTGITRVGAGCLLMAVVHVAHDCDIGDGVVIANNVVMGGHVEIGDRAIIGGASAIHQFVRVGTGAMVGGVSGVEADVIPYGSVVGNRARLAGLNIIGLKRRGLDHAALHKLRGVFNVLFRNQDVSGTVFAERLATVREAHRDDALISDILTFIGAPSKRGLIRTTTRNAGDDAEA